MKYIVTTILILSCVSLFAGTGFLPEDGAGLMGRIVGYGLSADVNEASGIFYNPAGIVNINKQMFEVNYQSIYNNWFGSKDFSFDGIFCYEFGGKFSIKENSIGIFIQSIENQFDVYDEFGNFEMQDSILQRKVHLACARKILKDFGLGVDFNLSQLQILEYNKYSLGTGIGIQLFDALPYSFGLYLKNLYNTGIKLNDEFEKENVGIIAGIRIMSSQNLNMYIGGDYEKENLLKFSIGTEYKISIFQIMAGYETGDFNTGDNSGSIGSSPLKNGGLKFGTFVSFKKIRIGYGLIFTNLGENHIFSFVYN